MSHALLFCPANLGPVSSNEFDAVVQSLVRFKRISITDSCETEWGSIAVAPARNASDKRINRSSDGQILLVDLGTWLPLPAEPGRDGNWLLELYRELGAQKLARRLQGFFALLIVDLRTRTTHIITDRCGSLHVFHRKLASGYAVCTSSAALAGIEQGRLDPVGLHEFIATGIIYEDRTLWADVKKVPAATVMTLTREGVKLNSYWTFMDVRAESLRLDDAVDATHQALVDVLRSLPATKQPLISDLTGGYDSRFLLAGLLKTGRAIETTVSGPDGHPDVLVARKIATKLELEHHHFFTNPEPSAENIDTAMRMTDGEYDAFDYARILQTQSNLSQRYGMSLNGSFGELARGYWWELLWPKLGHTEPLDVAMIARQRFAAIPYDTSIFDQGARLNLKDHMAQVAARAIAPLVDFPNTTQMDCVYYTMRMQRWQGRIASSTAQLWPAFSPIGFSQVLEPILAARSETRFRSLLVRRLFAKHSATLSRIPLEHGYPPMPASPFNFWRFAPLLGHYGGKVTGKLSGRFARRSSKTMSLVPALMERAEHVPLFRENDLREILRVPLLLNDGLFHPESLREFIDPKRSAGGWRLEQWRRLVTVEMLLRQLSSSGK